MPIATINGLPIVEGHLTLPRAGRLSADLAIDAESADQLPAGLVTSIDLGGQLQLRCTVRRSGMFAGLLTAEVVGGAAGLLRELQPKAYAEASLELVLRDALAEVGEQLAGDSEAAVLQVQLPKWIRIRALAAEEVASLLERAPAGAVARVKPDGTIWVGRDSYPDAGLAEGSYQVLRDDHYSGQAELGVEVPLLLPGTTFLGRRVEEATHTIKATQVRTLVQFAQEASAGAEPASSSHAQDLDAIILRRIRPHRYHRLFPARVITQNADGTLDLVLDDDSVPGLSRVPIRTLAPGTTLKVAAGARCAVHFEGGDPQRPLVGLFEPGAGTTSELAISATARAALDAASVELGDATAGVARVGDSVAPSVDWATWFTAVGSFIGTPPPPTTFGTIASGSEKVKA